MRALVVGGSASGKSAFAEGLACRLSPVRTYLATMAVGSADARDRIARHRAQRRGLDFSTVERTGSLLPIPVPQSVGGGVVLLDDLGNLVANALFDERGEMADAGATLERLDRELAELEAAFPHLVVVADEAGSAGPMRLAGPTATWMEVCGTLCCRLAARYDIVCEVVAGIATAHKGRLP